LLGNARYELIEAENGEEALAAVARRRPHLILMDIQLPIMDGWAWDRPVRRDQGIGADALGGSRADQRERSDRNPDQADSLVYGGLISTAGGTAVIRGALIAAGGLSFQRERCWGANEDEW
jgi:hypothetical protein